MNARATLANAAWLATSAPAHRRFISALRNPAATQDTWLRTHLARHADSAYVRGHGGREICTYDNFARRVPIASYDDLAPWIGRIRHGEKNVLTRDPVTRLLPTSGSTGARKLIPFTAALQHEFNAAIGPWIVDLYTRNRALAFGSAYWSVTPLSSIETDDTNTDVPTSTNPVPIGFDDDADYLGGARAWLVNAAMAVPSSVRHLTDLTTFRRTVLLHLLRRRDLRLISIWHPSFLSLLLDTLIADWSSLLAALNSATSLPRRRELRGADPTHLETIWPHLRVVSCWTDAHARAPAAELQHRLPHVTLQPKGLLATEACVTLPFADSHPLAIRSHFFEFEDAHGRIHLAADLRAGENYEVIVTTGGGLWRYRLGDRVEVTGFVEHTPTLRFLGRTGNISDRCGEKLSESFVAQVLATLFPAAPFALLAPEAHSGAWRYVLYLESDRAASSFASPSDSERLDTALRANPHYALCRQLGQLRTPRIVLVSRHAYARYVEAEIARGRRLGDIKPTALSQRTDWAQHFEFSATTQEV